MAQLVTDKIQHFIGYLHLEELLNLRPLRYEGAPTYKPLKVGAESQSASWELPLEFPVQKSAKPDAPVSQPVHPPLYASLDPSPSIKPEFFGSDHAMTATGPLVPLVTGLIPASFVIRNASDFVPGAPGTSQPTTPLPTLEVSYTYGGSQDQIIDVGQLNSLRDNDTVLDLNVVIDRGDVPVEVYDALEDLVALSEQQIPVAAAVPFALSEGISHEAVRVTEDVEITLSPLSESDAGTVVPQNGTYIDGVRISESGQSATDQAEMLSMLANRIEGVNELGATRELTHQPPANVDASNGYVPSAAQVLFAGENQQINVAILSDLGDAFGSRIILGDYHEVNVIAQVNVLRDIDQIATNFSEVDLAHLAAANILVNEASFVNEPGQVSGNIPMAGFNGVTQWSVDYVQGHLLDMSTVTQRNFMTDIDLGTVEQTQAYHLVTFGENAQLNVASLSELGKTYDLIIVGGDYYEYNGIFQFNIVLDDDVIAQIANGPGDQSAAGSDNELKNDAAIVSTGGQTFHALNDNVKALADAIAAGDATIDPYITLGLPGGGDDGTIDVLYVSGDYSVVNVILQTNVIADLDTLSQSNEVGGELDQLVGSAGNAALNGALIYDLDSQSDYQFLGGEAFEESILVQANILVDEDDIADAGLSEDAVAVVAALSALADDEGPAPAATTATASTGDADVLGSVLS